MGYIGYIKNNFKVGDVVGKNGCVLTERFKGSKEVRPKFKFKCGNCGKPFFARLGAVNIGMINSCGCSKLRKYTVGEELGPNKHKFIRELKSEKVDRLFVFKCSFCGNEFEAYRRAVSSGDKGSCGCKEKGTTPRTNKQKMRSIRNNMLRRCYIKKNRDYKRYGGRGITVCDRWRSSNGLNNFIEDMGFKPDKHPVYGNYTIDRVDNDKGYSKENCRWATNKEQQENREISKNKYSNIQYRVDKNKWCVYIKNETKTLNIGYAMTRQGAIEKYNNYIKENNLNVKQKEIDNRKVVIIKNHELVNVYEDFISKNKPILNVNNEIKNNIYDTVGILKNLGIDKPFFIENIDKNNSIYISYLDN